jgi:hypothetical protein
MRYGGTKRQGLTLNNVKIPTDTSIPVGTVLYTHKFGTGRIKHFTCDKIPMTNILLMSGPPLFQALPVFRAVPSMKRGLMALGFKSQIYCAVKMALWSLPRQVRPWCQ